MWNKLITRWRWVLGGMALIALLLQLANPPRSNPPVIPGHDLLATNPPPAKIAALLRAACYDCHSNETKWPWYSRVAPVSWWMADHIRNARKRLNLSEWPHENPERAAKKWNRIGEEVSSGDMPLPSYTWAHPAARLNTGQRQELANWAGQEARRLQGGAGNKEQL